MERMEMITQARKSEANLFTYLTPTNTTRVIKVKKMVPYTRILFRVALDMSWVPEGWKMAAGGAM